jgi:hypothetical protein
MSLISVGSVSLDYTNNFLLQQDIILATAVLHNLAILWKAEEFDEERGEDTGEDGDWQPEDVKILRWMLSLLHGLPVWQENRQFLDSFHKFVDRLVPVVKAVAQVNINRKKRNWSHCKFDFEGLPRHN